MSVASTDHDRSVDPGPSADWRVSSRLRTARRDRRILAGLGSARSHGLAGGVCPTLGAKCPGGRRPPRRSVHHLISSRVSAVVRPREASPLRVDLAPSTGRLLKAPLGLPVAPCNPWAPRWLRQSVLWGARALAPPRR